MQMQTGSEASGETTTLRSLRVLIVDDDPTLRNAYRRLLTRSFDLTIAESGEEALGLLAGGAAFDVLLVDLMMPTMDGTELHRRIVAERPDLDPHIVFVTGGETTLRTQRYLDERANERIYKPFAAEELRGLIRRIARARRP